MRVVFSTPSSAFGYSDETLFLVFDILLEKEQLFTGKRENAFQTKMGFSKLAFSAKNGLFLG